MYSLVDSQGRVVALIPDWRGRILAEQRDDETEGRLRAMMRVFPEDDDESDDDRTVVL